MVDVKTTVKTVSIEVINEEQLHYLALQGFAGRMDG